MVTDPVVLFVLGGVLLVGGAELLVRGASRLALAAGISPLVVGLTVVAFGTSAPELAVTVGSAVTGQADVALGNVIGSNIFNILFILGLAAMIRPLVVARQLIRLDVPLLIGVSALVLGMGLDGRVGRIDGALLTLGVMAYTVVLIRMSRREQAGVAAEYARALGGEPEPQARSRPLVDVLLVVAGLGLLVLGSQWLVAAAVETATRLGVSELVIGLTIVAAGTSLPEVATSVLAAVRGERDIAVGNAVGSCLFNLLAVLGVGSLVTSGGIAVPDGALTFDLPIMIAVAIAALPVLFTGYTISRIEGAVFLGYYLIYTGYLVLAATDHGATEQLGLAMVGFVLPLTAITLAIAVVRSRRGTRSSRGHGPAWRRRGRP